MAFKRPDISPPHARLRPGQDPTEAIERLYRQGRTHPRGTMAVTGYGRSNADAKLPHYDSRDGLANTEDDRKTNPQANQAPQDRHAEQYNNEPSSRSWLRGGGEDATQKDSFDHTPRYDRGAKPRKLND